MEKNNIVRIIGTYLSGRFSPETEEKVQKWIIKDRALKKKKKLHWNIGINWRQKQTRTLNLH